ncbi:voltage-dependent calcium channel subunit alpha-2/delta-1-like [Watersipora subatra]|uniref:voltage-dependent calcium channel subunit alpha-2/delta-1-like n=1 Tax=Watersipora subatra TaxID=2589382 RepID=UPI00355B50FD
MTSLLRPVVLLMLLFVLHGSCYYSPSYQPESVTGSLTGDVQNWAIMIQNYISQLASDGIMRDKTQRLLDTANYTYEKKNGTHIVNEVRNELSGYFAKKKSAAEKLATKIGELYDERQRANASAVHPTTLDQLPSSVYLDSDVPTTLRDETLLFDSKFRKHITKANSTVKISDEVPRNIKLTVDAVSFSAGLNDLFTSNLEQDSTMRWQYYGSTAGVFRLYPGREWDTNFAGFYNDYDPRLRPWYIAATSGPKDVVIILDCSLSMIDDGKFVIAQAVAKIVINTLTKQDYVNVICARASHWDEVGKWKAYSTDVLSCQQDKLVAATNAHRKDLIEKIDNLEPMGTSELEKGFEVAFKLLHGTSRTGCQSLIVLITDGKDTDGESVRCGPGYYTRSGYVPGPVCKYNWTKTWDLVKQKNPQTATRIFSYLTKDDGESFPGKLACENRGSMKKLLSGENLISEMSNYFSFLSTNVRAEFGLWTSPYLDMGGLGVMVTHAIPIFSTDIDRVIGVVGVDCTLDEIEFKLARYQWGSVYSFLVNKDGETIFHPLMKPSSNLKEDPIFIPIFQLEKEMSGGTAPTNFSIVERGMRTGSTVGSVFVEDARDGVSATYFYAALNDSEFGFAFSLSPTDQEYRRSKEPENKTVFQTMERSSYYNLLIEYNRTVVRNRFPNVFPYLDVKYDDPKYPGLRVTYKHSSIFLAPKCHCDSVEYIFNDDLATKTVSAHEWINGNEPDVGCPDSSKVGQKYEKGIRADVLITQPIEIEWKQRNFEALNKVKWTYVGLRSGVFRTYPGHRSTRSYDPTARPWYKRAAKDPSKTSISTPYMDAAGVGKIITISQALFEGMTPRNETECEQDYGEGPYPGGCTCIRNEDCKSRSCYKSDGPGHNRAKHRCATERVEGVTSLDLLYSDFHEKTMEIMKSSDANSSRSCSSTSTYTCPNGDPGCSTRCYLFDTSANMIVDPDFELAKDIEVSKYAGVTMGKKEGEIMRELIFKHQFFIRKDSVEFQGTCSIAGGQKVTLKGLPTNPEEQDDYYKTKGPIPKFSNDYGCIQDLVSFSVNRSALGSSGMLTGNVSGPCMQGFYYVTALPSTNLFLLVIENWKNEQQSNFFNFNCRITQKIVNAGAYRIINGTCADEGTTSSTLLEQNKCPQLMDVNIPCTYQQANHNSISKSLFSVIILLYFFLPVF